jgi:hypothetical protein
MRDVGTHHIGICLRIVLCRVCELLVYVASVGLYLFSACYFSEDKTGLGASVGGIVPLAADGLASLVGFGKILFECCTRDLV